MQLLPPLTREPKVIAREAPAGRHLPYARHVDDWTIETRDGLLMQVIQLRGLLFETADTDEINYRKRLRDSMLQAIGSSRFALYYHVVRSRVAPRLDAAFPDAFSHRIDAAWQARLATRQMFVNDIYLTLIRRPARGGTGLLNRLRETFGARTGLGANAADLRELNAAREALVAALGSYDPHLLAMYNSPQGLASEPLEFLARLYNNEDHAMLLPLGDLGDYLPWRRASFGQETVELGPAGGTPRQFVGLVSIKDYPAQTDPGMFDELLRVDWVRTRRTCAS